MKTIIMSAVLLGSLTAFAGNSERVILSDSISFSTEVSVETVRCSNVGYGAAELKINLAGLDGWTLFDHTNSHVGEFGEPCMTAGRCKMFPNRPGFVVEDLVQNRPGFETITVLRNVVESKTESKDQQGNDVCVRALAENLTTSVRGISFRHSRFGAEQTFPIEVCRK
jgi:hypothetical protein